MIYLMDHDRTIYAVPPEQRRDARRGLPNAKRISERAAGRAFRDFRRDREPIGYLAESLDWYPYHELDEAEALRVCALASAEILGYEIPEAQQPQPILAIPARSGLLFD